MTRARSLLLLQLHRVWPGHEVPTCPSAGLFYLTVPPALSERSRTCKEFKLLSDLESTFGIKGGQASPAEPDRFTYTRNAPSHKFDIL